jgi:BCD family chlorophyll transporter-like MFS transporter
MLRKRIQIGLLHVAVAMTLVPINSTLNRVMIKELGLSATLVAILASLPFLFSPIQVAIGSFADRRPVFGMRRTPYILFGLVLCVFGVALAPQAVFILNENLGTGLAMSVLAFGAWGMGYNFASVSYFALATEISGENGRSRTIAIMFFMMIVSIILTAQLIGRLLAEYSPEQLIRTFWIIGGIAAVLGILGLLNLEERSERGKHQISEEFHSWKTMFAVLTSNKQAKTFFVYLLILLIAILGQDLLLEPFGAQAFGLPVDATTRITSIWGTAFLVSLIIAGLVEKRLNKRTVARIGAWAAMIAFLVIVLSGMLTDLDIFYTGVVLLGIGTGLSTVSNLALMLDMTTAGNVGLFIGAWGMANAFSRLFGNLLSGVVRDLFTNLLDSLVAGYNVVFIIEAGLLLTSLVLLRQIDVGSFKQQANDNQLSVVDRAALAGEL